MKQSEEQVEDIRRRGIRRVVGRRALREVGRLVAEHEQDERAKGRLVRRLWLPAAAVAGVAAAALVLYGVMR